MRVIAGRAGGHRLIVPKSGVRPTMDRVKAAIFSSLGDLAIGARVLDLFAGAGGLGIEALSRGAESVLFVEQDRKSVIAIERNLAAVKLQAQVRQQDVFEFLKQANLREKFRIVFADPPYEPMTSGERFTEKLMTDEKLARLVEPDGLFVLEKRPEDKAAESSYWSVVRAKRYGTTEVLFLSPIHIRCPARPPGAATGTRSSASQDQSASQ